MEKRDILKTITSFLADHSIESFKELYHHFYKSLCFFGTEYLDDRNLIEDVVQDVFTHVWEKPPVLAEPNKLSGYLYAMVRNRCLNLVRGEQHLNKYRESQLIYADLEVDESLRIIKAEVLREVMDEIDRLPDRAKEVFKLSYLTQLREQEIAERLGISVNSVKTHKQRAKSILKDKLKHLFILIAILHI